MAVDNTGYNLGSVMVWLHNLAHSAHTKVQQAYGKSVSALNNQLRDISQLTSLLTKELPSGQAVLPQFKNVVDRVKTASKDLITVGNDCIWKSKDEIKAQLEL